MPSDQWESGPWQAPQQQQQQPLPPQYAPPTVPHQQPPVPQPGPRRNRLASSGRVICFVPVIGLLLSLLGLLRAKAIGVGRGIAYAGLVLSLVFTVAWAAAGYYVYKIAFAKPSDAGCVSAEADYARYSAQFAQDAAAMTSGPVGSAAFKDAINKYQYDLSGLMHAFDADALKAGHSDVNRAIRAVEANAFQLNMELGALASGNYAGSTHVMDLESALLSSFQYLETQCTSASNK